MSISRLHGESIEERVDNIIDIHKRNLIERYYLVHSGEMYDIVGQVLIAFRRYT
jgi:hypothetical protein